MRVFQRHTLQAVFRQPGIVATDTIDVAVPAHDEVLVRVRRVGICATDIHLLDGQIGDPFPLVPGHEFVGEIAAIGATARAARRLELGDRVTIEMLVPCTVCRRCREGRYNLCERDDPASGISVGRQYGIDIPRTHAPGLWGGYADYLHVPREAIVHRIPASVSWDAAVLVEPLAVAFRAVARGRVAPGDTVVVVGPGPVGLLVAAAARTAGAARVVVIGTRAERLDTARRFGADALVNIRETPDAVGAVRDALAGDLADVVVEVAGTPAAQSQALDLVRRGGRVVLAGACGAGASVTLLADEQLLTREIDLLPSFLSAGGYEPALAALELGAFPYAELVTHRFPLSEVAEALTTVRDRSSGVLKAVLVPHG